MGVCYGKCAGGEYASGKYASGEYASGTYAREGVGHLILPLLLLHRMRPAIITATSANMSLTMVRAGSVA